MRVVEEGTSDDGSDDQDDDDFDMLSGGQVRFDCAPYMAERIEIRVAGGGKVPTGAPRHEWQGGGRSRSDSRAEAAEAVRSSLSALFMPLNITGGSTTAGGR